MTAALLLGLLVVLVAVGLHALSLVRRLHRLHQRLDAARAALDAALARRAAVALRATGAPAPAPAGRPDPWGPAREDAENALGRVLARLDRGVLPPALAAELADAERLAVLGRAVHNDAVRDALALRTRRPVRYLRLAGTAPMPVYAEFAADPPAAPSPAAPLPAPPVDRRPSATR
jgi:hypothetical protein